MLSSGSESVDFIQSVNFLAFKNLWQETETAQKFQLGKKFRFQI